MKKFKNDSIFFHESLYNTLSASSNSDNTFDLEVLCLFFLKLSRIEVFKMLEWGYDSVDLSSDLYNPKVYGIYVNY